MLEISAGLQQLGDIYIIIFLYRWLLKSGKEMEAERVLKIMFGSNNSEQVMAEMNLIKDGMQHENDLRRKKTSIFKNLLTLRTAHRYVNIKMFLFTA